MTLNKARKPRAPGRASTVSALVSAATLVAGCALTPPGPAPAPAAPAAWAAPVPAAHDGSTTELAKWWSQFDDPLLAQLIDAAQLQNGNLREAAARIDEARANARIAGAGAWPTLTAAAGATRAKTDVPPPATLGNTLSGGLDMLWEIDVFGVTRRTAEAARARVDAAAASWHDLRVTLAAETASTYVDYRACEALVEVYTEDVSSQQRTADLTRTKADAGFDAPANSALATASAADASNRLIAQRADCDVLVKSLVALTALPENTLRAQLSARRAQLPQPATFTVTALPAQLLSQRPDLAALERNVVAASSDVGAAQADRYPRLSLSGTIAVARFSGSGVTASGTNWSIGPALSVPLFDAGRRAAAVDGAAARYEQARAHYEQRARDAVREVEQALVRLDAATHREADARVAASGFRRFFDAAQAQHEAGTGSVLDLESARRNALAAAAALVGVQRERVAAWVTLYRAVGGGWTATTPLASL